MVSVLADLEKMPGFVAGKKRSTGRNMCFTNLANQDKLTSLQTNHFFASEVLENDDSPILPGLPDDVAKHCLALVPRSNVPTIGGVCKRWRSFIQSKEFITVRKLAGMVEEWLYFLTMDTEGEGTHWEVMDRPSHRCQALPPMPGPVKAGFGVVVLNGKLLLLLDIQLQIEVPLPQQRFTIMTRSSTIGADYQK